MHPYGIELFIQERQRQRLLEAEQERLAEAARRADDAAPVRPYRPRLSFINSLRRLVQIAWTW
jgi:hypothetical protein